MWSQATRFRNYKITIPSIALILSGVFLFFYWIHWNVIWNAIILNDILIGFLIYPIKIIILALMSFYLYRRWFQQDVIYLTDAYFCFASFFGIWFFGKLMDVLVNLLWLSGITDNLFLLLLKFRYTIIVANTIPILYIGLEALVLIIGLKSSKEMTDSRAKNIRKAFFGIYAVPTLIFIWFVRTADLLIAMLPIITLLMYLILMIMFFFMYRNKRLSQVNSLLISFAFLLLILSNIVRALFTSSFESWYIILTEIIDTVIIVVLFIGFITKPKYAK